MRRQVAFASKLIEVRRTRAFVRDALESCDAAHDSEIVVLATSELVTNAIIHGGHRGRLTVDIDDRRIRITVAEDGVGRPIARAASERVEGGRGLALVDELVARWGTYRRRGRTTVWAEVDRPPIS